MSIIDINTVSLPPDSASFDVIKDEDYPFCILGFNIKNNYDQLRHRIPKNYNPVDIIHFVQYPETTPFFFRGIRLTPTEKLLNLINILIEKDNRFTDSLSPESYSNILLKHDFSAAHCNQLVRVGVYPFDGHCISNGTESQINLNTLYSDIFKNTDIPYFQSIGYLTLFVLSNKSLAKNTNAKIVKNIMHSYKNEPVVL